MTIQLIFRKQNVLKISQYIFYANKINNKNKKNKMSI